MVVGKACPLFVPLVEEGMIDDPVTVEMASRYLKPLMAYGVDTIVLGCTHYPLIRSTIRNVVGDNVTLVNPAYETAVSLRTLLQKQGIYRDCGEPTYRFLCQRRRCKIQFVCKFYPSGGIGRNKTCTD